MTTQPSIHVLKGEGGGLEGRERENSSNFSLSFPPILILAAGASKRMGRCKLTLPFGDALLITPVLQLARTLAQGMTVVVLPVNPAAGLQEEVERHGLLRVTAELAHKGQAESLKAGLREIICRWPDAPGVLVLLGDLPRLPEKAVRAVLDTFTENAQSAVVATYEGQRGHPVILPRAAFAAILELSGDTGAREVLQKFGPLLVDVNDSGVVFDVDEAVTYAKLT